LEVLRFVEICRFIADSTAIYVKTGIYIHPKLENWYKNLVIELVKRLDFNFEIEKSDLESETLI
jgi:hypothetical protein